MLSFLDSAWPWGAIGFLAIRHKETAVEWRSMCLHNLHQIAGAKDLMAREQHLTNGIVVAEQEIAKYMEYGWPICPAGGRYTANPIGRYPTCTTSGHLVGTMNPGSNRVGGRVSPEFPLPPPTPPYMRVRVRRLRAGRIQTALWVSWWRRMNFCTLHARITTRVVSRT